VGAYFKIRNAFHFKKTQPAESHILVQAFNAGLTAAVVLQNTTAIPSAGEFSSVVLWTDSAGADVGAFSDAPNDQVIYCNGVDNCIWGGDEMFCAAFITSTAAITDTATNPKDRTDIINNTKTDIENYIVIGSSASAYPPAQSNTYVKSTTKSSTSYWPYYATDPTLSLVGADTSNSWLSGSGATTNQRFHIDLGGGTIVKRIYYENAHNSGATTTRGVQNFTFWGSNDAAAFAELTYAIDTNWTELTLSSNVMLQHVAANTADPHYITVTNTTAYRYYAFKFADNYGGGTYMGVRRLELKLTASNDTTFAVGSTRPLQGMKIYVVSGLENVTASTLTGSEWDGVAWAALSLTDNTDTGASLAQTGTVTWSSTVTTSKPKYLEGYYLYWYQFALDAGEAAVYRITLDAPFQNIVDIWDGTFRAIAGCYLYTTAYADNTLRVFDDIYTSTDTSTYMDVSSLTATTKYVEVGFTAKQTGLLLNLPPDYVNTAAGTDVAIYYWDGETYQSVGSVSDGTKGVGTISLAQSGVMSWNNVSLANETRKTVNNSALLYFYRLVWDTTLDSTTRIYYIAGIPATEEIEGYKFGVYAAERAMLGCDNYEKKNEIRISAQKAPDVWNGDDSFRIEVGTDDALTCAAAISAQYASNIYNFVLTFKSSETWIMKWAQTSAGTEWERFQISSTVGCPAPLTLRTVSASFGKDINQSKMVGIWRGNDGIYVSNGQSPMLVSQDIRNVFDQSKTPHVNLEMLNKEASFISQDNSILEYHWLWASGTSTTLDKEYALDLHKWRWFEVDRTSGKYLQCAAETSDTYGNYYVYGCVDAGYMYRLENGTSFDSNLITCTMQSGDQILEPNDPLTETEILMGNMVALSHTDTTTAEITHYIDGATSGSDYSLSLANSTHRMANSIVDIYSTPGVFHSFRVVWSSATDTLKFVPMILAVFFRRVRDHIRSVN
jgi:hypothetical protein